MKKESYTPHMQWRKKETQHAPLKKESYFHAYGNWYYRPKKFQKGAYVLCRIKGMQTNPSKKMKSTSSSEGTFLIKSNNGGGRYDLATLDGKGSFRIFI